MARQQALQSNHIFLNDTDTESVVLNPTRLFDVNSFVQFESAEVSLLSPEKRIFFEVGYKLTPDSGLLLNFNRSYKLVDEYRAEYNLIQGLMTEADQFGLSQNTLRADYVFRNLGRAFSLGYTYLKDGDEDQVSAFNLGFRISDFTVGLNFSSKNEVKNRLGHTLELKQPLEAHLIYEIDDIQILLNLLSAQGSEYQNQNEVSSLEFITYSMGLVKNSLDSDGFLFYRVDLQTNQIEDKMNHITQKYISLPLVLGFESKFTDYAKLRGSIRQYVGVYKSENYSAGENSTSMAMGLGLHYLNQWFIDMTVTASLSRLPMQAENNQQMFSALALKYQF